MEQTIRRIRVRIDALAALTGMLQKPTRETSLAKTHFEESKMMLGKALSFLGTPNPYPESKNPDSPKIEPTAEQSGVDEWKADLYHVARVKTLRSDADQVCKDIETVCQDPSWSETAKWFLVEAFLESQKGMMWLGMELGRHRDAEMKKSDAVPEPGRELTRGESAAMKDPNTLKLVSPLGGQIFVRPGDEIVVMDVEQHRIISYGDLNKAIDAPAKLKERLALLGKYTTNTFIAMACHQANKVWCEAHGDYSQKDWFEAEQWQRESAMKGVEFRRDNPGAGKDAQHNAWMDDKIKDGWKYGTEKDAEKKTHPCIVPFDQLPEFQQKKDALFCAIVDALLPAPEVSGNAGENKATA